MTTYELLQFCEVLINNCVQTHKPLHSTTKYFLLYLSSNNVIPSSCLLCRQNCRTAAASSTISIFSDEQPAWINRCFLQLYISIFLILFVNDLENEFIRKGTAPTDLQLLGLYLKFLCMRMSWYCFLSQLMSCRTC